MRICHFTETLPGGPATYLNELVPLQQKRYGANNVFVAGPSHQLSHLKIPDQQLIALDYPKRSIFNIASLWMQWRKIYVTQEFDVLHLHSTLAGAIGRTVLGSRTASLVYCSHGWAFSMTQPKIFNMAYAFVEKLLSNRAEKIIVISEAELAAATEVGISAQKCHLVRNGIAETPEPRPIIRKNEPGKKIRLLFVGRFDHQKGFDLLLEAMSRLPTTEFHLTAIGGYVVSKKTDHKVGDNVTLAGWRSSEEIREAFAHCDAVVMPSRWEGFGLVAAEAMRAAVPVVASRVGGLSEIVAHKETGFLVGPGEIDDLVDTLLDLRSVDLPGMGRKGHDRFREHFTSERMERETHHVYEEIAVRNAVSSGYSSAQIGR